VIEHHGDLDVRYITDGEVIAWLRALDTGFLRTGADDAAYEQRRAIVDPARTVGAFDGPRCVATFRSFPLEVTVPGGRALPASGVTNVSTTATHRRRGLLTRMMALEMGAARDRGEPVAVLIAAEYAIYGRFGFGHATTSATFEVDLPRAAVPAWSAPANGRVDLVDTAEMLAHGPGVHDRFRLTRPGVIDRGKRRWEIAAGEHRLPGEPWQQPFHALYRDASGRVDGVLVYSVDDVWEAKLPQVTLTVRDLIAATPDAEVALWRYALSVDWVRKVVADHRAPDDVLPLLLGEPRAARTTTSADFMWLRLLDVPRALASRTYAARDALVLEVHDPAGHAAGRFLLDAGPDGAVCAPTTRDADLALDARALGSVYLGEGSVSRLAVVGRVAEERAGAAERADALFRTARRPWCPDVF
jgi:predicted acetyltransferase